MMTIPDELRAAAARLRETTPMLPAVAEPLATWLEAAAAEYLTPDWTDCPTAEAALAVARVINGAGA